MPAPSLRLLTGLTLVASLFAAAPRDAHAVEAGDVIFSELLIRSGGAAEWIELYNTTALELDLGACILREEGADISLAGLVVAAGSYAVLGRGDTCVAFDPPGTCIQPVALEYGGITLNDSDAVALSLVCDTSVVIDDVTYDWGVFADDCTGAAGGNCSVNLAPGSMSATDNDDWSQNWCVPPATSFVYDTQGLESVSTPGSANLCPVPGQACGPGDVIFTEFMVDPPDTSDSIEWFEMLVVAQDGCDLHGCTLQEGPFAEINAENVASDEWRRHVIDASGNTLALTGGQYALFAEGSASVVATAADGSSTWSAAYNYSGVSFANSGAGWLHLLCDDQAVDTAPYDWQEFEPACLGTSCSVNLPVAGEDGASNDDLGNWCLPPLEPDWISSHADQLTYQGTPGQQGSCQLRLWPAADQLVFTELMVSPQRHSDDEAPKFAEWFELYNPTDSTWELSGCRLLRERYDVDGGLLPGNTDATFLGNAQVLPEIAPGEARVFSKGCLLSGDDPFDPNIEPVGCEVGEYLYEGIDLTDSNRESLSLLCPDGLAGEVLVDAAGYDMTRTGNRKGRTMQFDYSGADETRDNADPYQWCEASLQQQIPQLLTDDGKHNYGTPGAVVPCASGQVDLARSGPGCRCDARGAAPLGGAAAVLLLGFGLPLLRRRLR